MLVPVLSSTRKGGIIPALFVEPPLPTDRENSSPLAAEAPGSARAPVADARPAADALLATLRPVYIVGMPRSGTTWLAWLLAQHPAVTTLHQSGLFYAFDHLRKWWTRDVRFSRWSWKDGAPPPPGALYDVSSSARELSLGELHAQCRRMGAYIYGALAARSPGLRVVVEQTPEHLALASFIEVVFPEARFLHLVRDPRAVYVSMREAISSWADAGSFPTSPIQAAAAWKRSVRLGGELAQRTPNYRLVRYETLHTDGPAELGRILAWLGLPTDAAACERAVEACRIDKLREKTGQARGFFRTGTAGGWREEISRSALRSIEYVCGDELERWGYERLDPRSRSKPLSVAAYETTARVLGFVRGKGRFLRGPGRLVKRLQRTAELTQTFQKAR
jgi:hypothetical protein